MNQYYLYSQERIKFCESLEKTKWKLDRQLDTAIVEHGYILPPNTNVYESWMKGLSKPTFGLGGVVNCSGEFIEYSACRAEHLVRQSAVTRDRFGGKYEFDNREVDYVDDDVVYCGIFWRQWGHFLIDQTARLWYALKESHMKLVWLIPDGKESTIDGNYLEFLKLLGIDDSRFFFVRKTTQFRTIYVPEPSSYAGRYISQEYANVISTVITNALKKYNGPKYDKVYFSRVKFALTASGEIGETVIENVFRKNGYEIIYPETRSVVEQIAIINSCSTYASLEGTIAHNSVFANSTCQQIVINRNRIINPFQFHSNAVNGVSVIYIDAWKELIKPVSLKRGEGTFWIDPSFVYISPMLKHFVKDHGLSYIPTMKNVASMIKGYLKYYKFYIKRYVKRR